MAGELERDFSLFLVGTFVGGILLEQKWWGWHFLLAKNRVGTEGV